MTMENAMDTFASRQYMVLAVRELGQVDFRQVLENDPSTVRRSVDGTLTFVKWEGEGIPSAVEGLETRQGPFTYEEMMTILASPAWVEEI